MTASTYNEPNLIPGKIPTGKIFLWLAIVSMIMLFAGLTSAYIVRQAEGNWLSFELPVLFYFSTAVIVSSSVLVNRAVTFARRKNIAKLKSFLSLTLLFGLVFVVLQILGWKALYDQHVVFGGKSSNPSGSFLYVLTGLHLLHLFGGIIYLIVVLLGANNTSGKSETRKILQVELCATYWHFLDALWVYLFIFLLFVR